MDLLAGWSSNLEVFEDLDVRNLTAA